MQWEYESKESTSDTALAAKGASSDAENSYNRMMQNILLERTKILGDNNQIGTITNRNSANCNNGCFSQKMLT